MKDKKLGTESLGLEYKPGENHYRAYVGPPDNYDLISAMTFNLLTCIGLRQFHSVLDIGCGSLRTGRLLIPYLNQKKYFGIEPNEWLVQEGIKNEIGVDMTKIKQPTFSYKTSLEEIDNSILFDFAVAQSIFSHTGKKMLENWLTQISEHLTDSGILLATFLHSKEDTDKEGWILSLIHI